MKKENIEKWLQILQYLISALLGLLGGTLAGCQGWHIV